MESNGQCHVGRSWVNRFNRHLVQRACRQSQRELLKVWTQSSHQRSLECWVKTHIPEPHPPHIPLETLRNETQKCVFLAPSLVILIHVQG